MKNQNVNKNNLTHFARQMTAPSGVNRAMDEMGKAFAGGETIAMFGGGNPAQIPKVTEIFKTCLEQIAADDKLLANVLGNYRRLVIRR
jgi:alanine-alpha-ketoisovalerate/valine-pyruvate aminotransferase